MVYFSVSETQQKLVDDFYDLLGSFTANGSAVIYRLIETAKANGQSPEIYIAELLKK